MNFHMLLKILHLLQNLPTNIAWKGLLLQVCQEVQLQLPLCVEALPTRSFRTLESLFILTVLQHVRINVRHHLTTDTAQLIIPVHLVTVSFLLGHRLERKVTRETGVTLFAVRLEMFFPFEAPCK